MNELPEPPRHPTDNRTLVRDMAVLQVKLLVDGFRDLVLVPASLFAAIASLVSREDGKPGPQFYHLLVLGKRSERWINLFGAARNSPENVAPTETSASTDIDDLVGRVESFVVDEYRRGGITAQAKKRLDQVLGAIQRRGRKDS